MENASKSSASFSIAKSRALVTKRVSASAPSWEILPSASRYCTSCSGILCDAYGSGRAPGLPSISSRWTVFDPTSRTPRRTMRSPPPPAAGYYLCAVPQVRRLSQSVRGAAHSANNPGGCPASAQRKPKNTARAQKCAEHPEHKRSPGTQKPEYTKARVRKRRRRRPTPHAGVSGRILRLQVDELLG